MGSVDLSYRGGVFTAGSSGAESNLVALRGVFDASPDGIFVTDGAGIIRGANARAEELFGNRESELIGRTLESLIPERLRNSDAVQGNNYFEHSLGVRKDGTGFPVLVTHKQIEIPDRAITLSFVRGMTEERPGGEDAQKTGEQFRLLVDSISDYAIFMLDKDGFVMTWNPGAERIKGYTAAEIVGRSFSQLFTREDIERGKPAELLRVAAQQGRVESEGWRVRKDGTRFWADAILTAIRSESGELVGYAKVTRDRTDHKRAEEAAMLRLSSALVSNLDVHKLLEAILASLLDVIPHDMATLALYRAGTDTLSIQFLGFNEGGLKRGDIRVPVDGSPAELACRKGEAVVLDEIQGAPFAEEGTKHLTSLGMRSACWAPLLNRGERIGALMVASRTESAFHEREVEMLTEISKHVAMAANNAAALRQAAEQREKLAEEKKYLEEEINLENHFDDIVGESTGLKEVLKQIETVAPTDATVLIQGETGTGKELLARAIHRLSRRCDRTFVKVNCAAIPAGLLESELFGHEKGSFTGAIARKIGRLELAHECTLFLDEVGELPLELQPKLLRALQEREIDRIGGIRPIRVNVRLIAATNHDLAQMVAQKQFRSDLFYRLKVFPISAPALRERADDIPMLVRHFVAVHSARMGKTIETIPDETMEALTKWSWPGNVRELENLLERAVILTRGQVLYVPLSELETAENEVQEENETLQAAEREHILHVLRESKGQVGGEDGAAERLGLKRTTLNSKMKKLGIGRSDYI
jgi:formate hydrogenlyase transcriptional activator